MLWWATAGLPANRATCLTTCAATRQHVKLWASHSHARYGVSWQCQLGRPQCTRTLHGEDTTGHKTTHLPVSGGCCPICCLCYQPLARSRRGKLLEETAKAVGTMPGHVHALRGFCSGCRGSSSSDARVRLAWLGPCSAGDSGDAGVAQALCARCAVRIHVPGPPSSLGAAGGDSQTTKLIFASNPVIAFCACCTRLVAPRHVLCTTVLPRCQGSCSPRGPRKNLGVTPWRPGWQVGASQAESEVLLAETRAADMLELELATELDFGGISTSQVPSSESWNRRTK